MNGKEIWKPVTGRAEGFPYEVSNRGRVRRKEGFPLKPREYHGGYLYVRLYKNGKNQDYKISALVADTFLGPAPGPIGRGQDKWQVDHINFNKNDNSVDNLEWVTGKENKKRAVKSNRYLDRNMKGERHPNSKLTEEKVREIKKLASAETLTQTTIAEKFNITQSTVSDIKNGRRWGWLK